MPIIRAHAGLLERERHKLLEKHDIRCFGLFASLLARLGDTASMTSDNQRNKAEKAKQVPEAGSGRGGLSGGAESGHTGAGIAGSDVSVGGSDGNLVGGPEGGESDMPASPREKASEGSKNNRR